MEVNAPTSPVIALARCVVIEAPAERVFAYAADLRNDAAWRQEIHATTLDTQEPGPGSIAFEDAFLSKKVPHSGKRMSYLAYEPGQLMRCTTCAGEADWQHVERHFRALTPGRTELIYRLDFEQKTVRQALGFAPPRWFLRWYSGWMMGKYLRQLKRILEQGK